jgi:nucleotide-binding universal stress UspA family protein
MRGSVVCCIDDSPEARDAARVARGLAARLGFVLVLLHVAHLPTAPGLSAAPLGHERLAESERKDAEALLDRLIRELGIAAEEVRRRVEFGDPAARVLAVCEQEHAEMVVLGSRRHGSLKAALLGSVSTDVAGKAPCIVVIVPPGAARQTSLTQLP